MNRQKLFLVAFVPAFVALTLAACSRTREAGEPALAQQSGASESAAAAIPIQDELPPQATVETAQPAPDAAPAVSYADVVKVVPVMAPQTTYGTVTAVKAAMQSSTTPREVCADVAVEERQPERDGNAGGTIAGAVIGGAIGNQMGKGDGKKAATVAGAVLGGLAGREIDKRHEGGKVETRTERQCHTEQETTEELLGYDVSYRKPDGGSGSKRMETEPAVGSRIAIGSGQRTIGYDVTYRLDGQQAVLRMDHKPDARLPVIDGQVVTQSAPISKN